jgi:hypothetical protein
MDHVWIVEWKYRNYTPTKWTPSGLPYTIDAFPTHGEALTICRRYQSAPGCKGNLYRVRRYDRRGT